MQIIEVSVTGVRSAVITLSRRDSPLRFVLFPMIHLGTPGYYRAVTTRLGGCDYVVAEGIRGRSSTASAMTLSYRLLQRNQKPGLVVQDLDFAALGVPVIWPDMTGDDFEQRSRKNVPAPQRVLTWCATPFVGAGLALFGTRRLLGRHLAVDDLPTREQEFQREGFEDISTVLLDQRDALLLDALVSLHREHGSEAVTVGVVYGAGHMAGICAQLRTRLGYRPRDAEWLTVFDF